MVPLAVDYLVWHYTRAVRDLLTIVGNFIWFFYNFFSLPLLLKTLFVPFHRLEEHAASGLDLGAMLEAFMVNILMRCVGAVLRIFVLLIGILFLILTFAAGCLMLVAWLASPAIVVTLFALAFVFLKN